MPPPTEPEWTPRLVLKYVMRVMDEREKRYAQRFAAQEEAIKKESQNKVASHANIIIIVGIALSMIASVAAMVLHFMKNGHAP